MTKPVLIKTCSTCGLQKPLSAFLELGGPRGTVYGNICASCRKTAMEKNHIPKDTEGSTTSTSGHRVDAKAKVQGDTNKKEAREELKERYEHEREKDEKIQSEHDVAHEKKQEHEKRKSTFDKSSWLSAPRKPLETKHGVEKVAEQAHQIEQSIEKAETNKLERQQKGIDFTSPAEGFTRVAGQARFGAEFRKFATLLGAGTAVGRTMGTPAKSGAEKNAKTDKNESENPLVDYIEKTWKPKSGR